MGESKRRKQSDPNYGKTEPIKPELINYCNSAIAQESAFIILDYWSDAGGIAIAQADLDTLQVNQRAAREMARQQTLLKLGLRRQKEQSLGCLSVMDRHFRASIGMNDFKSNDYFIFNWLSNSEIEKSYREFYRDGKGRAALMEIMSYLISNCDPNYQFPCWFSGVPLDNSKITSDLIFVVDSRNPSSKTINTHISYQNYL